MNADVILAADFFDLSLLKDLVQLPLAGVKIGFSLGLTYGIPNIVELVINSNPNLRIIYDHQKAGSDIPDTAQLFIETCHISGVKEVILFGLAGIDTMESLINNCEKYSITPWIGVGMSHSTFDSWIDEEKYFNSLTDYIRNIHPEFNNFVAPSTKPWTLDQLPEGCRVMVTGIGRQKGNVAATNRLCYRLNTEGQRNVSIIVGSMLYNSSEPERVLENINFL